MSIYFITSNLTDLSDQKYWFENILRSLGNEPVNAITHFRLPFQLEVLSINIVLGNHFWSMLHKLWNFVKKTLRGKTYKENLRGKFCAICTIWKNWKKVENLEKLETFGTIGTIGTIGKIWKILEFFTRRAFYITLN